MFKPLASRQAFRALGQVTAKAPCRAARRPNLTINTSVRGISSTRSLYKDENEKNKAPEPEKVLEEEEPDGRFARTDESITVEYPPDEEMPRSPIVQGRGGMHFKRTLASFSLEGKTSIVTGGARGLGLVMGQAIVASGSDLAIVDLNSKLRAEPSIISPHARHDICRN